jgi:DNA-binding GntR family transcriptional regulator
MSGSDVSVTPQHRDAEPPSVTGRPRRVEGVDRRAAIVLALRERSGPHSGTDLAREHGVSRQAIVNDVRVLRDEGFAVSATARGYVLGRPERDDAAAANARRRVLDQVPAAPPSLAERTYGSIRDAILTGRLPMGARLLDVRLAEDAAVSRSTVRQALSRLVDEGLAVDRGRRGLFVQRFGGDDLIALYNVRTAIEPVAARLIVRRGVAIDSLRRLLDGTGRAYASGDVAVILAAESAFHVELVRLGGNRHLLDLYRAARSRFRMAISRTQQSLVPEHRATVDDHPPIVAALAAGDEYRAAWVVHWHIVEHVEEAIVRLGADPAELLPPPPVGALQPAPIVSKPPDSMSVAGRAAGDEDPSDTRTRK